MTLNRILHYLHLKPTGTNKILNFIFKNWKVLEMNSRQNCSIVTVHFKPLNRKQVFLLQIHFFFKILMTIFCATQLSEPEIILIRTALSLPTISSLLQLPMLTVEVWGEPQVCGRVRGGRTQVCRARCGQRAHGGQCCPPTRVLLYFTSKNILI